MTALEAWRKEQELSYAQLAQKLGESTTSVFEWCQGNSLPRSTKWKAIAKKTGLTVSQVIGIA